MLTVKQIKHRRGYITVENKYTLIEDRFPSKDGKSSVAYYIFEPKECSEIKGIVQISHGMCEYFLRYSPFAEYLAERGYIVCGHDHIGHGRTAACDNDLGFTSKRDAADFFIDDMYSLTKIVREKYAGIPLCVFGHSMGSFVTRNYLAKYKDAADAAVISGTAGSESPSALAKQLAKLNMLFCGERNRSKFIYGLAFGSYSKKYPKGSPKLLWLTRDKEVRERYQQDKYCNFFFTAAAYKDLFELLSRVSKRSWANALNKDTPILLISGDMDPVGNYGKGVREVFDRLSRAGVKDITLKLYEGAHHEMLNELCRDEVYVYLEEWLYSKLVEGKAEK